MKGEFYEFEVSWSDLDANRHMANFSYVKYCDNCRVHFFHRTGLDVEFLNENLGPVIFHEHFYYMKELMLHDKVKMNICLRGNTPDYKFVEFEHNMFKENGQIAMHSTLLFTWLDLEKRVIALPTKRMIEGYGMLEKSSDYRILDPSESRLKGVPYGKTIDV